MLAIIIGITIIIDVMILTAILTIKVVRAENKKEDLMNNIRGNGKNIDGYNLKRRSIMINILVLLIMSYEAVEKILKLLLSLIGILYVIQIDEFNIYVYWILLIWWIIYAIKDFILDYKKVVRSENKKEESQ